MSTLDAPPAELADRPVDRRPRTTLLLLRIVLVVHTAAVVAQPVIIGQYLAGNFDSLAWHSANANLISLLVLTQIALTVLYWRPGGGRGWPALVSVALFLAEGTQIGLGYSREVGVHVPLGVVVTVAVAGLTVWSFLPAARRPRPSRRRSAS